MLDRKHPQQVALDGLLQGEVERNESTRDRRGPGTTIGLQDVTVDHDGPLTHQGHVDGRAQRTTDQPLDFLGAAIDPTRAGFARGARLGCPRQHRVLGGYPAFARALLVRGRLVVPAGRAQHPGVTMAAPAKMPIQNLNRWRERVLALTMPARPSMVMARGSSKVTPKIAMRIKTKLM